MRNLPEREREVLAYLAKRYGSAPKGQIWAGDDAALVAALRRPLISTDLVVEGVHVDRRFCAFSDMGFKAVSANVSDIAAMGGVPRAVVIAIAGATGAEIREIMLGAEEAANRYGCDIVGGDVTSGATLVVSVTALGECEHEPIRRSGARVGDLVYVTGLLGASSAGLRELQRDLKGTGPFVEAYRRPIARVGEGRLLGVVGAHATLDCSDGLASALHLIAERSGVGVVLEVLPRIEGATIAETFDGGEDYELAFCLSADFEIEEKFVAHGYAPPIRIGAVTQGPASVTFEGRPLEFRGFEHHFGEHR